MAWTELGGSRKIEDNRPRTIDYIITFTAPTGETPPTNGETLSDVLGSGSLPSTGLAYEPEAARVSEVVQFTVNKAHVTIVFRGYYTA